MKSKSILYQAGLLMLGFMMLNPVKAQDKLEGKITLSGAWALYPMAVK